MRTRAVRPGAFALVWIASSLPSSLWGFQSVADRDRIESASGRAVEGHVLTSDATPEIEIEVAEEFGFVGHFPFEILGESEEYPERFRGKPVAAGERFVFAVSDENNVVEKLFIVQFEGFLPSNEFVYNYNFDTAESIGENKYRQNLWFYDARALAEDNPNSEGALTRRFLSDNGYSVADEYMMSRFVGLASEDRKSEIIIFYFEMLEGSTGHTLESFENSLTPAEMRAIREAFTARSRESFTIIAG